MNLSRSPLLSMFQPTLPLRGATGGIVGINVFIVLVSTHAPLAGSDRYILLM